MEQAACAEMDREAFYSTFGRARAEALAACRRCPVRAQCLAFAIDNREEYGVWGGTTATERLVDLGMPPAYRGDWVARMRGCGSQVGVANHRHLGTPLCGSCGDVSRRQRHGREVLHAS